MFVRALYFATATTAIAAIATEPWHVAIAFFCQGLFSGFIPAAVALTSVTVPDDRLSTSLGLVTGAQYLGNTVGPAIGALLAIAFGFQGAIIAAAIMPAASATVVVFAVPRDRVGPTTPALDPDAVDITPARSFWRSLGFQFWLAIALYFFFFAMSQLIRTVVPIAIGDRAGDDSVEGLSGIAFTVSGVASVVGVLVVSRRWVVPGRFVLALTLGCLVTAAAHVALALSPGVAFFIGAFSAIALFQAAMLPAANTLIAANVDRSRRGTAFGIAGSAQALAFMTGPMGAALFAAASLEAGFIALGVLFAAMAGVVALRLREPPRSREQ
jgi:DHA1 family multidrug resistance protein-like MFS transporter